MGARQLSPEPDSRPPTGVADIVPKPRFAHTAVLLQGTTPGSLVSAICALSCPGKHRKLRHSSICLSELLKCQSSTLTSCSAFMFTAWRQHRLGTCHRHSRTSAQAECRCLQHNFYLQDMVVIGGVNHHQDLDEVLTWHCDRADLQLFQDLNVSSRVI